MGLNNFILTCEKDNEELRKDINYYNNMTLRLKKENQKLKKQVEDLFSENRNLRKKLENFMTFENYKYTLNKKIKLETQQKEFIKYLEDKMNLYKINTQGYSMNLIEEILQKYKSIIGGNDV